MRKTICTASIFAAIVGLIAALFIIQVPDNGWVKARPYTHNVDIPLIVWMFFNVVLPVVFGALACLLTKILWDGSAEICAKLRGEH